MLLNNHHQNQPQAEANHSVTLLYLTIAYLLGIALGRFLWAGYGGGCQFPGWLWWLPLGLLLLTPLLHRLPFFLAKARRLYTATHRAIARLADSPGAWSGHGCVALCGPAVNSMLDAR
jgi:hypothetical protein